MTVVVVELPDRLIEPEEAMAHVRADSVDETAYVEALVEAASDHVAQIVNPLVLVEGAIPASIKHAVLLLVAHWYANREAVAADGAAVRELPMGVSALLAPYKIWRV